MGLSVRGNVGIGITTPLYPLHVIGNVGIGSSLTTTGLDYASGGLRVNGFSDLTGNVGVGGTGIFNSLIQGLSGLTVAAHSGLATLSTSGNVSIGASLTVSSTGAFRLSGQDCTGKGNNGKLTADASGNVYCADDAGAASSVSGDGVAGQITFWTGSTTLDGNNAFFWDNAGMRLGIGSSAPGSTLGVFGSVGVGASYGFATLPASANNGLVVEGNIGVGTSSPTASVYVAGNVGIGWTGVNLSSNMPGLGLSVFGNVGIGTTSPSYPLHVTGNVGIGSSLVVSSAAALTTLNVTGISSLSGNVGVGLSLNVNGTDSLVNASNLNVSGTSSLGNAFTGALTVGGTALIGDGGDAITLSGTTITLTANTSGNDITLNLVDNNTDALDIQQGSDNYLNINTTNSAENISFGNSTTNPRFIFNRHR
ncbi:hypothetical protein HYS94_01260 [Candidatus Daviesbacteria bacterium]|nr:hypothetical protein [Candidatus Daviesbacteria bacterium]